MLPSRRLASTLAIVGVAAGVIGLAIVGVFVFTNVGR